MITCYLICFLGRWSFSVSLGCCYIREKKRYPPDTMISTAGNINSKILKILNFPFKLFRIWFEFWFATVKYHWHQGEFQIAVIKSFFQVLKHSPLRMARFATLISVPKRYSQFGNFKYRICSDDFLLLFERLCRKFKLRSLFVKKFLTKEFYLRVSDRDLSPGKA